jgi:ribosomal-protein-alanine N-acetyltransferase
MTHKGTITLETERLILRRYIRSDLEPMFNNCWNNINVWKWTNYEPMESIEDILTLNNIFTEYWFGKYRQLNFYNWAIHLKSYGEVIGRVRGGYGSNMDERIEQIELAYELGEKWWNQGLMTEAVKKVIDFFFNEIGFNRVYSSHAHKNPASGKVMQKCGMTYEGIMRQAIRQNNNLFDKVNYAILADEYKNINAK